MPSNFARLSEVSHHSLPRFSRKLRANPSLTRTTSPIWPSLATRSSKITSMSFLLSCLNVWFGVKGGISGDRQWWRPAAQVARAKSERGIGKSQRDQRQHRPHQHQHHTVG